MSGDICYVQSQSEWNSAEDEEEDQEVSGGRRRREDGREGRGRGNVTSLSTCGGGVHYSIERRARGLHCGLWVDKICMYALLARYGRRRRRRRRRWCQTADDNGVPPRITMWVDSGGGMGTRGQPNVFSAPLIFPWADSSPLLRRFIFRSLPDIINITSPPSPWRMPKQPKTSQSTRHHRHAAACMRTAPTVLATPNLSSVSSLHNEGRRRRARRQRKI